VTVVVVMIAIVRTIVAVVTAALTMTVFRALTVAGDVAVVVDVFAMRAADAVHDIQHARENALQHINKYQRRALAN
jgi:hypothetical protein